MHLIDTHCHLHDREFFKETQAEEMLKNARARGVRQIICIGTSHEDSLAAQQFAEKHKNVFWTYGIHPEEAKASFELGRSEVDLCSVLCPIPHAPAVQTTTFTKRVRGDVVDERRTECCGLDDCERRTRTETERKATNKLVAIGEIGLDYHYPGYDRQAQIKLLEQMLDLAVRLKLPCSFHVRDAFDDFFAVTRNFRLEGRLKPSVIHSFSDSKENLLAALNSDFYIGINGLATFANLDCYSGDYIDEFFVRERVVLETDAPFLTPASNRGKINEPGNVADVASWLARKIGVTEVEIAEWTTKNARKIFNLPDPEPAHGADSCA